VRNNGKNTYLAGSMILPVRLRHVTMGFGAPTVKHGSKTSPFQGVKITLPKDMIPAGTRKNNSIFSQSQF